MSTKLSFISGAVAAFCALAMSACASEEEAQPLKPGFAKANPSSCPFFGPGDWRAWVDKMPKIDGQGAPNGRLHIVGRLSAPTPVFEIIFEPGPADRAMPPAQTFNVVWKAPTGIVSQVVVNAEVRYSGDAAYSSYRAIKVVCGDKLFANIEDVDVAY